MGFFFCFICLSVPFRHTQKIKPCHYIWKSFYRTGKKKKKINNVGELSYANRFQMRDLAVLLPSCLSCGTGVVSQAWLTLELSVLLRFNLLKTQTEKRAELGSWAEV